MNTATPSLYTNEVSPERLRALDNSIFTEQQLAIFSEQVLAIVNKNRAYAKAHPPIAIYRVATEGSQTRNGGVIQQGSAPMQIKQDNGQLVRAARKGDWVVYPDGTKAQIMTCGGKGNSHIALVGSVLSNGDQIINTPQAGFLLFARKGVPMAEDFLPTIQR